MSKSLPIVKGLKKNGINDLAEYISKKTQIKTDTVKEVLRLQSEYILDRLCHGEHVHMIGLGSVNLRRREYSKERQEQHKRGFPGHFPPFCYYPYLEFSTNAREEITRHKDQIEKIVMGENHN